MHYFTGSKKNLFIVLIPVFFFSWNLFGQSGNIHYWMLEESVPPFKDINSSLVAGSFNPPEKVLGIVGFAQKFDTLSRVFILDDSSFDWSSGQSFSIEFWMKDSSASTGENEVIIGRDDPANVNGKNVHWWIGLEAGTGYPVFLLRDNYRLGTGISGPVSVTDGKWHLFAAVRSNTVNKNYLYIDGQLAAQGDFDYLNDFSAVNVPLNIGYLPDPDTKEFHYNGILDEIAVYNRTLSAVEINRHYNNGLSKMGYNGKIVEFFLENARVDSSKFKFDIFVRNSGLTDTNGFRKYLGNCRLSFTRNVSALDTNVRISDINPVFDSSYDFSAKVDTSGNINLDINFVNPENAAPLALASKKLLCTIELSVLVFSAANPDIKWIPENLLVSTGDSLQVPAYLYDLESIPLSAGFSPGLPIQYQLEQNYPNPFNPVTVIMFALPKGSKINLSVYNILGEKIKDLVSGFIEAGIHSVEFEGKNLNSGVYIYKLETENFVQVRKMILLK